MFFFGLSFFVPLFNFTLRDVALSKLKVLIIYFAKIFRACYVRMFQFFNNKGGKCKIQYYVAKNYTLFNS